MRCGDCGHDRSKHDEDGICEEEVVGDADSDYQLINCTCDGFRAEDGGQA